METKLMSTVARSLRKRKHTVLLVCGLVSVSLIVLNWNLSKLPIEKVDICGGPFSYTNCGKHILTRKSLLSSKKDIYDLLNLTRVSQMLPLAFSNEHVPSGIDEELLCRRPQFEVDHDSLKYAFYPLGALNCSGADEVFQIKRSGLFKLDKNMLKGRSIDRCEYHGIVFGSDQYFTLTTPHIKTEWPFDLVFKEDFVNIKCFLKGEEQQDVPVGGNLTSVSEQSNGIGIDGRIKLNTTTEVHKVDDSDEQEADTDRLYYMYDTEEQPEFDQYFAQVNPKRDVFDRIAKKLVKRRQQKYMDVLMIGLDSMSRLAYQRKLPKTYAYLKKLGAVVLEGYNIVGDATTAAIIPMLTGKTEMELPEIRVNQIDSYYVDVYPLIWKTFRESGYVTMFAEDDPTISIFNLRFSGFEKPPTDHYMRPFWQAVWQSSVRASSKKFCTGSQPNHMYLLNYTKDFFIQYKNVSKFAFVFGSELTHADNNPGEYMDSDFVDFLKYLYENGYLDNTLLMVMADHGARYSRVRKTVQGKMEERLPMMSLRFPHWFKAAKPRAFHNLLNNTHRLTTPFDIYETLCNVLNLDKTEKSQVDVTKRGLSLLQPVPLNRTCASAGVQMHWCVCLKQYVLNRGDKLVVRAADAVIAHINRKTKALRYHCRKLVIRNITQAYLLIPNEKVLAFQNTKDGDKRIPNFNDSKVMIDHVHIQVTIETHPGGGLFESTVQLNVTSSAYEGVGEISRLNRYGDQPACIQAKHPDLRKFCLCKRAARGEEEHKGHNHSKRGNRVKQRKNA